MRTSTIKRNTEETKIELSLNLDGKGESKIDTGCGFFDHMLTLFAKHSKIDLDVTCKGDINVEICSKCHPFYTGKQKIIDAGGRVDRFRKRFGNRGTVRN